MRVTIEHREREGIWPGRMLYYVDCTVQFSEEERAIINTRGMTRHLIELDPPRPPPSMESVYTSIFLVAAAPCSAVIGLFLILTSVAYGWRNLALGAALFVGSPFLWAIGYFMQSIGFYRLNHRKQYVTIASMRLSKFSVWSPDPAYSELIEDHIREKLTFLKERIVGSAEMRQRQSYEL